MTTKNKVRIPDRLYFRIGDVAALLKVKPSVLRYWEAKFSMLHPGKSSSGQRVYRRSDVEALLLIKRLLYQERYSIAGAQKRIKELRKKNSSKTPPVPSPEDIQNILKLAREIKVLISRPIGDLFPF